MCHIDERHNIAAWKHDNEKQGIILKTFPVGKQSYWREVFDFSSRKSVITSVFTLNLKTIIWFQLQIVRKIYEISRVRKMLTVE